ncbi:class I SAM-dependent methyltransferase [Actinoplanes hulinensis]|uniref:Class I SAM-dependent methyltransferase n=1 Tax=Actinoplanes hulinensis TaxID=1144547 RepID=A0ABS7AYT5_9ACTN|nr:class I SAM-dependent methyltransferase [Actinoplanes hulinensis]MBW6433852.1 class I SAM-dependent methyltransferase [Actinoplanes hulinensis]
MSTQIRFDRRASAAYDRRATRLLHGFYRRVAGEVAAVAGPGAAVLDVGTGPGRLLHELAARRPDLRLAGADLSPDMAALARRSGIRVEVADVARLPWPDDSLDLIVSTLSAHEWPDPEAAAAELFRVLRPGGRIVIHDFRFARLGRLRDALDKKTAGVRREPHHPLSIYTRIQAAGGVA